MGKLTALKPTLGNIAPRLGYASGDEKAQDKSRNQLAPWRAWYKTTRWTKLRQTILLRDLYTCKMCGRIASTGMVVDHVRRHSGDERLFWDEQNLQVLCAACHNSEKQRLERAEALR